MNDQELIKLKEKFGIQKTGPYRCGHASGCNTPAAYCAVASDLTTHSFGCAEHIKVVQQVGDCVFSLEGKQGT